MRLPEDRRVGPVLSIAGWPNPATKGAGAYSRRHVLVNGQKAEKAGQTVAVDAEVDVLVNSRSSVAEA